MPTEGVLARSSTEGLPAPAESCRTRGLCGWSPPSRPADTNLKRRIDRALGSKPATCLAYGSVVALLSLAPHLAMRASLGVVGIAALIGGGWCSLNFWRCRHAHCVVTGVGWLALAIFVFVESGLGHSVITGYEQPVLLGVLGLGLAFEAVWYVARGTSAVTIGRTR